jgi:hypothetical protein
VANERNHRADRTLPLHISLEQAESFASALLGGDPSSGRLVRAFAGRVKKLQVRRRCKPTPAGLMETERIRTP